MAGNKMLLRITAFMLALMLVGAVAIAPVQASAEPVGKSVEIKLSDEEMDISVKAYLDLENMVFAIMGAIGAAEGDPLLDAAVYLTQDSLLLNSETILDQAYGIYLPEAAEKLPQSIFAPDSGSAFAMNDEDYQSVLTALESVASAGAGGPGAVAPSVPSITFTDEEQEKLEEILTNYQGLLSVKLMQNMELSMAPETVQVGDQSFDTTCITVKLGKEELCNILGGLLEAAAEDQELMEACVILLEQLRTGFAELDTQLGDLTSEETVAALWAQLPNIRENVLQGIAEADMWISASVNMVQESDALVQVWVTVSANDDSYSLHCSMGESLETSDNIELEVLHGDQQLGVLTLEREADGYAITAAMEPLCYILKLQLPQEDAKNWETIATLMVMENDQVKDVYSLGIQATESEQAVTITGFANGTTYGLSGQILEDNEEMLVAMIALTKSGIEESSQVLVLQLDKQNNQYAIQVYTDGASSTVSGFIKDEEDCVIITIDEIDGQPIAASIILRGTDTISLPGSYAEILDMDEEGFGELVSILQQVLQLIG